MAQAVKKSTHTVNKIANPAVVKTPTNQYTKNDDSINLFLNLLKKIDQRLEKLEESNKILSTKLNSAIKAPTNKK